MYDYSNYFVLSLTLVWYHVFTQVQVFAIALASSFILTPVFLVLALPLPPLSTFFYHSSYRVL